MFIVRDICKGTMILVVNMGKTGNLNKHTLKTSFSYYNGWNNCDKCLWTDTIG